MSSSKKIFHIAQVNVGRMRASKGDPSVAEFYDNLDRINELAEQAPGFVWRLQSDEGNATSIRIPDDDNLLINLSVWESVDDLKAYVYDSEHLNFVKKRKEWFEPFDGPYYALWWISKGCVPTVEEAMERLRWLEQHGPSDRAFLFTNEHAPPSTPTAFQQVKPLEASQE